MRRDVSVIERGTNFDDISPAHVEAGQSAQHAQGLARGKPARDRRTGPWCERRIDGVDIERDVDGTRADPLAELGADAARAVVADVVGRHDRVVLAARERIVARTAARTADADLVELTLL